MAKMIGMLAMLGLAVAVMRNAACSSDRPPDPPSRAGIEPGNEIRTQRSAVAGRTTADLERAITLIVAKTQEALVPLVAAGSVAVLSQGTLVRVIQTSWGHVEVRVLAGPRSGEHWWVDRESLK